MALNPLLLMKLAGIQRKFAKNHPKVLAFVRTVIAPGLPEGTVLELTVTKPGEAPISANMKVMAEDIELLREMKALQREKGQ